MYTVLKDIFGRDLANHISSFSFTVEDEKKIKDDKRRVNAFFPHLTERISFTEYMLDKPTRSRVFVAVRVNPYVTMIREKFLNLLELKALGVESINYDNIQVQIHYVKIDIEELQEKLELYFNDKNWLVNFIIDTYFEP